MKKTIVLTIVVLFCLSGCSLYNKNNIYKKQAKENAIGLFKEKYNITPDEIKSVRMLYPPSIFGNAQFTGISEVKLTYKDKEYIALVDSTKKTNIGYDNYQYDQINKDLVRELDKIHGIKARSFALEYNGVLSTFDYTEADASYINMISEYYDGSNLKSITSNLSIIAAYDDSSKYNEANIYEYIDMNFHDVEKYGNKLKISYFKNKDDYNKFIQSGNGPYEIDVDFYMSNHIYVDFIIELLDNGKIIKHKHNVKNVGNDILMGWDTDFNNYKLSKSSSFDLNKIERYESDKYTVMSDYYTIEDISISPNCSKSFRIQFDTIGAISKGCDAIAIKAINCKNEETYSLRNAVRMNLDGGITITKYVAYKSMSFVLLKEKRD